MLLKIKDETFAGDVLNEIELEIAGQEIAVKDIIEMRVEREVENYNQRTDKFFNGLVVPTDAEKTLNGYKMKRNAKIDAEKQVYLALAAFQKNGYFVLIDDVQSETLDQIVKIGENTKISFIKLTPLIGG
jgi:hypothetical protein